MPHWAPSSCSLHFWPVGSSWRPAFIFVSIASISASTEGSLIAKNSLAHAPCRDGTPDRSRHDGNGAQTDGAARRKDGRYGRLVGLVAQTGRSAVRAQSCDAICGHGDQLQHRHDDLAETFVADVDHG